MHHKIYRFFTKDWFRFFNTLLNKLSSVMPELHLPDYNYCGPFTILDKRLARVNKPINKLDA
jgi:hypothetical protein